MGNYMNFSKFCHTHCNANLNSNKSEIIILLEVFGFF